MSMCLKPVQAWIGLPSLTSRYKESITEWTLSLMVIKGRGNILLFLVERAFS